MEKLEEQMRMLGIELKNLHTLLQQVLDRYDKKDDEIYFDVEQLKTRVDLLDQEIKR